ncbi:sensor histidine kinase [Pelosinus propionicus]|uniref:histidine kinase n=1 Tax=Pelosinus propionicus DSM 13327 TaxID=1123291 RepID=A0A1I4IGL5_9FIRM|nr:HAMP domain-containing sensor histidine kinase [Pelosinus propionicus]SFL53424.1 His Kinase A (phospho-acceptor) domain-containing protein [Pelosinus propionicus DSM 13327]
MFHKLRLQLAIIHLIIIAVLFLILTVGTYFFAENQMRNRAFGMGIKLISDIQSGLINDLPDHGPRDQDRHPPHDESFQPPRQPPGQPPPEHPLVFFVKTDADNKIFFTSSTQPLDFASLSILVQESLGQNETTGTISLQESYYYYVKAPLRDQSGMVILFQNFDHEKNLLHSLIKALIIVGILCLLLSLVASLYMAHRAMIPISSAWEQQKNFIADVSHELRTPLTVMQTNLEIVLDNPEGTIANQSKWLHNIKEETDAMAKLITSLLFLARADSRQPLLEKKVFSLSQGILRSIEALAPLAAAKEIALELSIAPEIQFYGDEGSMKQLISIFFDNSIRHTPSGGKFFIILSQSKKEITFIFTDTGEGIENIHLEKIFDRFYQVDKSRFKGGTGLGLSIAKLIVESHGGTIKVSSQPLLGTKFCVKLPIS